MARAELSDLQRAEAERLLYRRGYGTRCEALKERLLAFVEHPETFALPNKKAAYELTHIVYYLSDYGARSLSLSTSGITSLEFAGLLAYLDQDIDLLSEICVAMRFAGQTPSDIWEDWIADELGGFMLNMGSKGQVQDAYHEYLVSNWWASVAGLSSFHGTARLGGLEITRTSGPKGPLRAISEVMYHLGAARSSDWHCMRQVLERALGQEHHQILEEAAQSSAHFDAFFEGFARAH